MAAGEPFGITPYGTEAMHVLRAEKGFVIVGQDTDGTVTPDDLGMCWIVNPSKGDFLGQAVARAARHACGPTASSSSGCCRDDPDAAPPGGGAVDPLLDDTGAIPVPMVGHVTSSYQSAALGRTFALAMVEGGRELRGRTIYAALAGGTAPVDVTDPVFYDAEGARRDG